MKDLIRFEEVADRVTEVRGKDGEASLSVTGSLGCRLGRP